MLAENTSLVPTALSASTVTATIKKIAAGVEITDEAVLSGFGDPMGEAAKQITLAHASALDNDMLGILHAITGDMLYSASGSAAAASDIVNALELFGEDIEDGPTVALVSPAVYTEMRTANGSNAWVPASEVAANIAVRGIVGEFNGCQVIVSNKLGASAGYSGAGEIYLVKPGALRTFLKRDTLVEYDRDILRFVNVITGSKHFVNYLYDESKAIRIAAA